MPWLLNPGLIVDPVISGFYDAVNFGIFQHGFMEGGVEGRNRSRMANSAIDFDRYCI
jgi:hypothetical protein